ncbi:RNA polymerase sigma factor [Sporosarcina thermotolerans]|uniref:RNA polymerase sigma factor n=1 Tax=Sporosarcina thermotolerans TaxID=633404 RepID=A0AAW9A5J7_9BACL|nr:RNA polymerase sigma factor [Sporosarcina thermotolerans]MDW0116686.1 RNA polymerase sigma factor [Sporosarcina thermotolerans]
MNVVRLVKKAKKGNKEALLELIMAQQDDYYRLALTYTGNPHDAMDAMEDMIVSLYEKMHQLKKEDAFYSWSKTILVNRCKLMLKKQGKVVLLEEWEQHESSHNPHEQREQQLEIQDMLELVNDYQREAIQLKYLHDLDYETIAEITNVSVGTAKSRVFQGLKKIKEQYRGESHE